MQLIQFRWISIPRNIIKASLRNVMSSCKVLSIALDTNGGYLDMHLCCPSVSSGLILGCISHLLIQINDRICLRYCTGIARLWCAIDCVDWLLFIYRPMISGRIEVGSSQYFLGSGSLPTLMSGTPPSLPLLYRLSPFFSCLAEFAFSLCPL